MALTASGVSAFTQIGHPRWRMGGLVELDSLEVTYRGLYSNLDTFRNSLTKWTASTIDPNMFLETWSDDGAPVQPKITLRYIGCKGGQLPTPSVAQGSSLATVSTTDGENQLSVLYRSPHTQTSWIGASPANSYGGEFSSPGSITIIDRRSGNHIPTVFRLQAQAQFYLARATAAGASPAEIAALQAAIDAQLAAMEAPIAAMKALIKVYFNSAFNDTTQQGEFEAVPLVPGRYWACHSITSNVLVPF